MGKYGREVLVRPRMGAASLPARKSQDGERKKHMFSVRELRLSRQSQNLLLPCKQETAERRARTQPGPRDRQVCPGGLTHLHPWPVSGAHAADAGAAGDCSDLCPVLVTDRPTVRVSLTVRQREPRRVG